MSKGLGFYKFNSRRKICFIRQSPEHFVKVGRAVLVVQVGSSRSYTAEGQQHIGNSTWITRHHLASTSALFATSSGSADTVWLQHHDTLGRALQLRHVPQVPNLPMPTTSLGNIANVQLLSAQSTLLAGGTPGAICNRDGEPSGARVGPCRNALLLEQVRR